MRQRTRENAFVYLLVSLAASAACSCGGGGDAGVDGSGEEADGGLGGTVSTGVEPETGGNSGLGETGGVGGEGESVGRGGGEAEGVGGAGGASGTGAEGTCGDGVIQADRGEKCDDGDSGNSDTLADACRSDCQPATCGDGVVDSDEECDDGDEVDNDVCSNDCIEVLADLCLSCSTNDECGRSVDRCTELADGSFCTIACSDDEPCPDGFDCSDEDDATQGQCVPTSGVCSSCWDPDNDSYGVGPNCLDVDCDQDNAAVNPGATELCNGRDDDCDGVPDGSEGLRQPCGESNVGICTLGTSRCDDDGNWICDAVMPLDKDLPDMGFEDASCDGIDGDVAQAVFVAPTGDDASPECTQSSPCATIHRALQQAVSASRTQVLVQSGTYEEVIALTSDHNGIGIYGGYDIDWHRGDHTEDGHVTLIRGGLQENQYLTVRAAGVQEFTLQNLELQGPDASGTIPNTISGQSSHVMVAIDSSLELESVVLTQGDGAPGGAGTRGPDSTSTGNNGTDGTDTLYWFATGGAAQPGGNGGSSPCGRPGGDGGEGGTYLVDLSLTGGRGGGSGIGIGGLGGSGGDAGDPFDLGTYGGDGGIGNNGSSGAGGQGARRIALRDGLWPAANTGTAGGLGGHGSGGGGGGGGGALYIITGAIHGGGGGGGGGGGCRSTSGGTGGGGGGLSIGLLASSSSVNLIDCDFILGNGGNGAQGGGGGYGASGGTGGAVGSVDAGGYRGGKGGDGGRGGNSGGGGGGAGGPVFGVYSADSTITESGTTFTGGQAGIGGDRGIRNGTSAGTDGLSGTVSAHGPLRYPSGLPLSIPDYNNAGINSVLSVSGAPQDCAVEATVNAEIWHGYPTDLLVTLSAPNGDSFILANRRVVGERVIYHTAGLQEGGLVSFANGHWVLNAADRSVLDVGTLQDWSLSFRCID